MIHQFLYLIGVTGSSYWANFWDGFGSGPVAWLFLPLAYWHHHTCHARGCYRMGHPVNGAVRCRKHLGRDHEASEAIRPVDGLSSQDSPVRGA